MTRFFGRTTKILLLMGLLLVIQLPAQTIAEKKAGIVKGSGEMSPEMQKFLVEINKEIKERKEEILKLQNQVGELYKQNAPPESYRELLGKINAIKEEIRANEESWREMSARPGKSGEGYALWHQPETNLEQLVIDYGSSDYVYLIPSEIGKITLSVSSNIPIPQASWGDMLQQILLQNGVGIKILNPFLRQLYLIHKDFSTIKILTANPEDLEIYPDNARVGFVVSPDPMDVTRIWYFLEKFIDPNSTVVERVGRVILIVGQVSAVNDLLKLYDFVSKNKRELEYRAIPLQRVDAEEMAKILQSVFEEFSEQAKLEVEEGPRPEAKDRAPSPLPRSKPLIGTTSKDVNSFNVIALPKVAQAVFLIGTKEEIKRAEDIIKEVEGQIGEARDKSIFWYEVKHSDPEEIAQIAAKVYLMMIQNRISGQRTEEDTKQAKDLQQQIERTQQLQSDLEAKQRSLQQTQNQPTFFSPPFYQQGDYTVNPAPIGASRPEAKDVNKGRDNFIVDPKTGSLVMVIETDLIPRMKELLIKLDVPKRMVQIEVMLFERTMKRTNSYGLNMLKMGDVASRLNQSASAFNGDGTSSSVATALDSAFKPVVGRGIFEFFYSCKDVPMDFAYKFMMTQDNVSLNASPTVVTMNQTQATIAIKDERSILVGTTFPESSAGVAAQNNFTRAQYGITITVTPTIHMADKNAPYGDPINYVSLVSYINFDTFPPGQELSDQPLVNRREIINEVRIPDGQTVIVGGLRQKKTDDTTERIPFLGEIPGLGKLFSHTSLSDDDTELIIFITPKIISDPADDFARLRTEQLCLRPGDLPAFMYKLNEALDRERFRVFQGYMSILFGRPKPRYICQEVEYHGR